MFPMVEIEVEGLRGRVSIQALLDTGFSDCLCLPTDIAVELGLPLGGSNLIEYADGRQRKELYFKGQVTFVGVTQTVDIYLTDSDEPLAGMKLLQGCQVLLDIPREKVKITRIKPKKKKTDQP